MSEFGHVGYRAGGFFCDSWGRGPYRITASGKAFYFEDSDRFGPALIDIKTLDPTNELIPAKSPFWRAYERWRAEGRKTMEGKPMGTRKRQVAVMYCVHSDVRTTPDYDAQEGE